MIIELDMASSTPIYVQLRNQIVKGIGKGELKAGEKYIVKYTANISVDSSGNWDGAATVNNTAKATIKVESNSSNNVKFISDNLLFKYFLLN